MHVTDQNGLTDTNTLHVNVQPPPGPPPNITLTNPQEGDQVEAGTLLASWTIEGSLDRFTVFLNGIEDANTTENQLRLDLPEGEHTIRVHASGPGGQSTSWANFTAVDETQPSTTEETTTAPDPFDEDLEQLTEDDPDETPLPIGALLIALLIALLYPKRSPKDPP